MGPDYIPIKLHLKKQVVVVALSWRHWSEFAHPCFRMIIQRNICQTTDIPRGPHLYSNDLLFAKNHTYCLNQKNIHHFIASWEVEGNK